jgi:ATP-dependent Clp protease, protease subunit
MDVKKLAPGRYPDFWMDFSDVSIESLGAHILFGEVTEESMKDAVAFILKANHVYTEKELTLFLNTRGGNVEDGFSLIDVMECSKLPIKTVGIGNIMSMGVLIFAAGKKGHRVMTRNTTIMAHQFSSGTEGKFHELMATLKGDLYMRHQFIEHFKRHSTMDEKTINAVMFGKSDEYLTPAECKRYGIVDHIVDELPEFNLELPLRRVRRQPPSPSAVSKRRVQLRTEDMPEQKKR